MSVAAVVLAAGRATRFGATKQLALRDGAPLVAHPVRAALAAGVDEVVVVVGHDADAVGAALPADPRVRAVDNPRYAEGQSTSLRAGIGALGADVAAVVVLLGDEPDVRPDAVEAVVGAWRVGAAVARAGYDDGPGHPVCFDRSVWPRLTAATGDEGARGLLRDLDVVLVPVAGARPTDVDVPADL